MEELKYMLFHASLELDRLRAEAAEGRERNREYAKQLIHLLKITCKERDEARDDLQKLLAAGMMASSESNAAGFSDRRSSSVESLLDAVSPPPPREGGEMWGGIMEGLGEGKPLPQNGKFLQAVLEAGPLLQTVMVTGPLPRWRNPPRLVSLPVPPAVPIKGENLCGQRLAPNPMLGFDSFGGHYGHLGKRQRLH
ncbi:unnamed protein product [Cuscuta campestris]|uniref:Uncharacterized protein n=1 Tax=Cuscuta campestris TaxID=132261 RepID=A0A484NC10_9ASTE|nr:unnamed protein product [Cuscuta campestris]